MELFSSERRLLSEHVSKTIFWILVTVAGCLVLIWWMRYRKCVKELNKLPTLKLNLFTDLLLWCFRTFSRKLEFPATVYYMQRLTSACILNAKEGIFVLWFFYHPVIYVFRTDLVKQILTVSAPSTKSQEQRFLTPFLGLGVLTSEGERWKSHRKLLTPAFDIRILENFLPIFNEQSMVLVKKFRSLKGAECANITPYLTSCALDIICESAMGVHINTQGNSESEYGKIYNRVSKVAISRLVQVWYYSDYLFYASPEGRKFKKDVNSLHELASKVIKEKKEAMIRKSSESRNADKSDFNDIDKTFKKKPFLDMLLDLHINQQLLSEKDVEEEVKTFIAAGHETTAASITWALFCIGLYPRIQERIIEEIDYVFEGDNERPVTSEDLRRMTFLDCTFKESLRLYPAVPVAGRRIAEDTKIDGVVFPEGATIYCMLYMLHRNPKDFLNPEFFDPDRFLPEITQDRDPYAFMPFAVGPRNCIGQKFAVMEVKVVIANILRRFQIVSLDQRDNVPSGLEIILSPGKAVRMKFIPRDRST